MSETPWIPKTIRERVVEVRGPVTSGDIDSYGRLREIEDRSYKLRTVLDAWERQHSEERVLRKRYANTLLVAAFVQLFLINLAFFQIGRGNIVIEQWVAATFITGVFGEIVGVALIVTRHLFPEATKDVLQLIEKL